MESVSVWYLRTRWFVPEISLVRFLILRQLVRKYHAFKNSLTIHKPIDFLSIDLSNGR